jgi:hypothetical protein
MIEKNLLIAVGKIWETVLFPSMATGISGWQGLLFSAVCNHAPYGSGDFEEFYIFDIEVEYQYFADPV